MQTQMCVKLAELQQGKTESRVKIQKLRREPENFLRSKKSFYHISYYLLVKFNIYLQIKIKHVVSYIFIFMYLFTSDQ